MRCMKRSEIIEIVGSINEEIYDILADIDAFEAADLSLEYRTNGTNDVIMFMGTCIWDYDVDER